ncbi:MAG TPA: M20/M25/M40 family metallo-hydrolase [Gemmatimonadaceae bacterium]|nr:M20/M25/M40 family metallo-hydrolase [Gemmatimonadaceae bacterium]
MRKISLFLALVVSLTLSSALRGQTFPTDDPIIKRIWAIGMDSSQTMHLAQVLFDSIGPRLTGSPDQKRGNDWLIQTYKSWGIDAKNEQYGTWRGWRRGYSHIDLVSPRVRSLEGTMVGYSPGTGGKDLTASPVILPHFADSAEFVKWLPAAKGKLVLVSAPMPTCRPPDDWEKNATPDSKARMDTLASDVQREWGGRNVRGTGYSLALGGGELGKRLEEGGVAGVITSRPKLNFLQASGGWGTIEVFETYNTHAPTVALSCEDYGLVYRLTENNQSPKLRLNLDAELLGERPVYNTVAMIKGSEKPDEYVMLSAHFDSWDGSSGATDNGTGTLTMLEAMRILKKVYPHPKRTILVGHWSAEEEGEVGSKAFTEDHPEVLKGLQALFNQDNGTGRIVRMGGGGLPNAAEHITQWLDKIPTEWKTQINFAGAGRPAGGGSDDFSFACYGLPAFGLGALPWDYNAYTWHTNRDTYDKVVFDDLKSNATLTAMLAYLASEDPTMITRERVDLAAMAQAAAQQQAANPAAAGRGGRGGRGFSTTWPECSKAPRTTNPRLK